MDTGSISDFKHSGRLSPDYSTQTIEAVCESVAEAPGTSIPHRDRESDTPISSL